MLKKLIQLKTISLFCSFVFCLFVVAIEISNAAPTDKLPKQNKTDDFGAETIEEDTTPLPLGLVEQQEDSTNKNTEKKVTTENNLKYILSKALADGESGYGVSAVPVPKDGEIIGIQLFGLTDQSIFKTVGFQEGDILKKAGDITFTKQQDLQKLLEQVLAKETVLVSLERATEETIIPVTTVEESEAEAEDLEGSLAPLDTTTLLNVNDVEIATLVKTFSKLTKRNYIVDNNVKGKITIHLPTPVSLEQALRILDSVLLLKGFTTVPVDKNTWKVINAKDARQTTIPLTNNEKQNPSDIMVTTLVRLKHIAAQDVQQLLGQFISKDGILNSFAGTNSLVLIDSAANIKRLQELIKELDVPALDQDITIIPILYAEAKDIAEKIEKILGEDKEKQAPTTPVRNTSIRTPSQPGITNTVTTDNNSPSERRSLPLKIIPDERTNAVIVVADPEMTLRVKALVEQLDSRIDQSTGRFWVYRLKHADAEQLAEIINSLISGTAAESSSEKSGTQGSSISRKSSSSERSSSRETSAQRINQNLQRNQAAQNRAAASSSGEGKVTLEGEVFVAPDTATNSLIINASKTDYERVKDVIEQLDIKRKQVLVEATVLEVRLSKNEALGVELQGTLGTDNAGLFAQSNFGGLTNLLTNPAALADLTLAAASTGTLTLPGGLTIPSQAALVSAVSRVENVNVLSTPTIMATDNEEAEIIVGQNVPFVTGTSTDSSTLTNRFNSIERQDVGITLRITPQISDGEFVMLKIFVEISNVVARTQGDPNGPTTTIRTTETTVAVKNNQMVITGGLLQDDISEATRGIPFLQDIPVLGQYFQRQEQSDVRTNLLVFITPKIIEDQFDARDNSKLKANSLENELNIRNVVPKREEILKSDALDNVVEVEKGDANNPPSTITAPTKDNIEVLLPQLKATAVAPTLPEVSKKEPPVKEEPPVAKGDSPAPISEIPLQPDTRQKQIIENYKEETAKKNASNPVENNTIKDAPPKKREILEFKVRPKLPSQSAKAVETQIAPTKDIPDNLPNNIPTNAPETTKETKVPTVVQPSSSKVEFSVIERNNSRARLKQPKNQKSYLVFRQLNSHERTELDKDPNVTFADKDKTFGLTVSEGTSSTISQFFTVGGKYKVKDAVFVCLGHYSSLEQASEIHTSLKNPESWNEHNKNLTWVKR
jgi:general secretion pathway protein D